MSQVAARMSGFAAARRILDRSGLTNVPIEVVPGHLSDHYDPTERVLRLSPEVYEGHSMAAVGIAAHEAGHALQHAHNYALMGLRSMAVPAAQIGSGIGTMVASLGVFLVMASAPVGRWVLLAGIVMFAGVVLFSIDQLAGRIRCVGPRQTAPGQRRHYHPARSGVCFQSFERGCADLRGCDPAIGAAAGLLRVSLCWQQPGRIGRKVQARLSLGRLIQASQPQERERGSTKLLCKSIEFWAFSQFSACAVGGN